jgi:hypothetical protein
MLYRNDTIVVCCGPIHFLYATPPPTFTHRFKRVTSC